MGRLKRRLKKRVMAKNFRYLMSLHPNVTEALKRPTIIVGLYLVGNKQRPMIESMESVFSITKEGNRGAESYYLVPKEFCGYKIPFSNIHDVILTEKTELKRQDLCMTA